MERLKKTGMSEINLLDLFKLLLRKSWLIMLIGILVGLSVFGVTKAFVKPKFTSSISLYVNNSKDAEVNNITSSDISASIMLANTYLTIIQSDTILEEVLVRAESDLSMEEFKNKIKAANLSNTEIMAIEITTEDAEESAELAQLLSEVVTEQLPEIVEGSSVKILQHAKVADKKSSPSYVKRTLVGCVAGAFLAIIFIILFDMMDNRIRTEKDFEQWPYPILGVIPDMNSKDKRNSKYYYSKTYK